MNTYIPADKLIAEIERLLARANRRTDKEHLSHNSEMEKFGEDYWNGYGDLAYSLLGFITSLQQEQPTRGYDEAYLNECIAKARKTWKGVDVDKYMDEMRGREQEQPKVDLEKEILDWIGDEDSCKNGKWTWYECNKMLRRFYELGLNARKEK